MDKKIIFIFIFIIVIAGFLYYIYINYEPKESNLFNVSISAIDKNRIKTGFEIQPIGITGNTSETYELVKLTAGEYTIKNINIENQNYYEIQRVVNITETTRIDLILEKPSLPSIKVENKDNIILDISSKNFQDVDFCLKGSINYLFIRAEPRILKYFNITDDKGNIIVRTDKYQFEDYSNYHIVSTFEKLTDYQEIKKEGFENYDRCYDGEFSLKDSNKIINISYTKLSTTNSDDFINFSLIDSMGNVKTEKIK